MPNAIWNCIHCRRNREFRYKPYTCGELFCISCDHIIQGEPMVKHGAIHRCAECHSILDTRMVNGAAMICFCDCCRTRAMTPTTFCGIPIDEATDILMDHLDEKRKL